MDKKEVNHGMGRWVVEGHAEPGTMMSFVEAGFTAGFCAGPQRKSFFLKMAVGESHPAD